MKPIENKQPLENELIDHIRENLIEHEETYRPGAWEDFNRPEKKKRGVFWIEFIGAAAAILLIGFISFLLMNKPTEKPVDQLVNIKKTIQNKKDNQIEKLKEGEKERKVESLKEEEIFASKHIIANSRLSIKQSENVLPIKSDSSSLKNQIFKNEKEHQAFLAPKNNDLFALLKNEPNEISLKTESIILTPKAIKQVEITDPKKDNIIEFFENENKKNKIAKTKSSSKKQDKFTLGLMVAPSFGNVKKLNMGYGIGVDYNFSDKLSLSSGIAYNKMGVAKNLENGNTMPFEKSSLVSEETKTRTLRYVEENVAGIDIPLEVKYHFNKNIYANAGVSALAVINQSRNNTYLEEKVIQRIKTSFNGDQELNVSLVSQPVTERREKTNNYSYLGFYNFSFGYKRKISRVNSFAIEPFIKLPMREVTAESLRLMGTGVKLKIDF